MDEVTTLVLRDAGDLAGVRDAARRAVTPLLWLLRDDAAANDGTLSSLAADGHAPMVSLPLTDAGEPADAWIGSFADGDIEGLVAAAHDRRVPLRFTPVYSMLVARDLVLSHDAPDESRFGPYADIEWTARLFAGRPGMLVPASTVTVPARRQPLAPQALLRLGPRSGLRRTDRLRQLRIARGTRRGEA